MNMWDITLYAILASITTLGASVPLMMDGFGKKLKAAMVGVILFEIIATFLLFPVFQELALGTGLGGLALAGIVNILKRKGK